MAPHPLAIHRFVHHVAVRIVRPTTSAGKVSTYRSNIRLRLDHIGRSVVDEGRGGVGGTVVAFSYFSSSSVGDYGDGDGDGDDDADASVTLTFDDYISRSEECRFGSGLSEKSCSSPSSSLSTPSSLTTAAAAVATITISNPRRRNALTPRMMDQFSTCVDRVAEWCLAPDNEARCVLLTGAHGTFCSGLDLRLAGAGANTGQSALSSSSSARDGDGDSDEEKHQQSRYLLRECIGADFGRAMATQMNRSTNLLRSLPIVSVAAVDGYAVGGGAELTTSTDLRVLSYDARVVFVHLFRGAVPGWGGARRLVSIVGRGPALRLLLGSGGSGGGGGGGGSDRNEGRAAIELSGADAVEKWGFADHIADEGETSMDAARRLVVSPILDLPCPASIRAFKRQVGAADGDFNGWDVVGSTSADDVEWGRMKEGGGRPPPQRWNFSSAMREEIDAFAGVWGSESNKRAIQSALENLTEGKK